MSSQSVFSKTLFSLLLLAYNLPGWFCLTFWLLLSPGSQRLLNVSLILIAYMQLLSSLFHFRNLLNKNSACPKLTPTQPSKFSSTLQWFLSSFLPLNIFFFSLPCISFLQFWIKVKVLVTQSCPIRVQLFATPWLWSVRLLCPWNSPDK